MLERQKNRIHERSKLRAKGWSEEEIREAQSAQELPFRPAFENGKRRPRAMSDDNEVPTGQFAFRRPA